MNPTIVRRHLDVHTLEVAADGFAKVLEINTIKLFAVLAATLGKLRLGVIITLKISLIIFSKFFIVKASTTISMSAGTLVISYI